MNKTLTISVIALVAVVMGMSSIVPVLAGTDPVGGCRPNFTLMHPSDLGSYQERAERLDRNNDSWVCVSAFAATSPQPNIIIDNRFPL